MDLAGKYRKNFYEKYIKRILDFVTALTALIILAPVFVILIIVGAAAMRGNPFFSQPRPGKDGHIFYMIKFRTMSNEKDSQGNLLPDDKRLNKYGKLLRSTSLDELPELWNIVRGELSLVGPRPQLTRDMVFMNAEQKRRYDVRQGLTGLAQVNGRNNLLWEEKLEWDLKYIDDGITLKNDLKIIFKTIYKVFSRADIAMEGMDTAEDFGDYLLRTGKVDKEVYDRLQEKAKRILQRQL